MSQCLFFPRLGLCISEIGAQQRGEESLCTTCEYTTLKRLEAHMGSASEFQNWIDTQWPNGDLESAVMGDMADMVNDDLPEGENMTADIKPSFGPGRRSELAQYLIEKFPEDVIAKRKGTSPEALAYKLLKEGKLGPRVAARFDIVAKASDEATRERAEKAKAPKAAPRAPAPVAPVAPVAPQGPIARSMPPAVDDGHRTNVRSMPGSHSHQGLREGFAEVGGDFTQAAPSGTSMGVAPNTPTSISTPAAQGGVTSSYDPQGWVDGDVEEVADDMGLNTEKLPDDRGNLPITALKLPKSVFEKLQGVALVGDLLCNSDLDAVIEAYDLTDDEADAVELELIARGLKFGMPCIEVTEEETEEAPKKRKRRTKAEMAAARAAEGAEETDGLVRQNPDAYEASCVVCSENLTPENTSKLQNGLVVHVGCPKQRPQLDPDMHATPVQAPVTAPPLRQLVVPRRAPAFIAPQEAPQKPLAADSVIESFMNSEGSRFMRVGETPIDCAIRCLRALSHILSSDIDPAIAAAAGPWFLGMTQWYAGTGGAVPPEAQAAAQWLVTKGS